MALRIGLVGLRGIGLHHAECYCQDSLAELVAVCDIVPERADEAAEKHGVPAYYSLEEMLEKEELEIVDVSTRANENGSWHFEPAMQAMEAKTAAIPNRPVSSTSGALSPSTPRKYCTRNDSKGIQFSA